MDVKITPSRAKEILDMWTDWEPEFIDNNKDYQKGYIGAARDFLAVLGISREDLKVLSKRI